LSVVQERILRIFGLEKEVAKEICDKAAFIK
jgi:hypothetical protein